MEALRFFAKTSIIHHAKKGYLGFIQRLIITKRKEIIIEI
jgi:hypothetical protein